MSTLLNSGFSRPSVGRFITIVALLVSLPAVSQASPAVATVPETEAALAKFIHTWETKDTEAAVATFAADAVAFDPVPGGRFDSPASIRAWIADSFKVLDKISITVSDVRIKTSGPVAWLTGGYVFKAQMDGKPAGDAGIMSMVWVKQPDGAFKLEIFHASIPLPPEPAPAAK